MSASAIDSLVFNNMFGTELIRTVFSDKEYIQRCLEVEAALARAEAEVGIIPKDAARHITSVCEEILPSLDLKELSDETTTVGYPILPLVTQLFNACGDEHGKYVHWGATTQDIQDTASAMQMREGLTLIDSHLRNASNYLARLAKEHRDTPMAGRTHLQHALPITFGYKCAVNLSTPRTLSTRPIWRRGWNARLPGLWDADSDLGLRVRKLIAEDLRISLHDPPISWHTARDGVAEILNFLALVGGSLGKIATDLSIMSSNELGEVSEPFVPHRGASSTMPQKRNPISCEVILAAARVLRSNAGLGLDAMLTDFERATGPWHLEWVAVPESFLMVVGALKQAEFVLKGLVVNVDQMAKNLNSTRGLIVAEAVMMELAKFTGRQKAHEIVYHACTETIEAESEGSLFDTLAKDSRVTEYLSREKLEELCEPRNYLGAAGSMVNDVLALQE